MPRNRQPTSTDRRSAREPIPVEVTDRGDEYLVAADLPGRTKQDIDVSVKKRRVAITADAIETDDTGTYLRRERPTDHVRRVVTLPEPVDEKHVDATFDRGRLYVTLPKRTRSKHVRVT